ncbi:MAG: hypothetical protein PVS2B2_24380 [Candidatus Acidiferrum sp.]
MRGYPNGTWRSRQGATEKPSAFFQIGVSALRIREISGIKTQAKVGWLGLTKERAPGGPGLSRLERIV